VSEIHVRPIHELPELREAVRLQKVIWGFDDIDLLPVRLFVVAGHIGGQRLAAFDGETMVGFLLAIPGLKKGGKVYLHSHMMGVLAEYRNAGVGRALKLAQRVHAFEHGVNLVEWTFDPLQIKNAFFNIERLGAVISRYVLNQYGITSSPLQAGLPTDRCIAEWFLDSPRVNGLLGGSPIARGSVVAKIAVPNDIEQVMKTQPSYARDVQVSISEQFLRHFGNGLVVTGFERGEVASSYLLTEQTGEK
jgi:predicted GNAT superfamily acetyltransferase